MPGLGINKVQPMLSKGRSRLIFEYYKDKDLIIRILDFFENVQVKESQKSNLISYNPISRAGSLYSYGGAKSRTFNLSFNITAPAVLSVSKNYFTHVKPLSDRKDDFFTENLAADADGSYFDTDAKSSIQHYDQQYINLVREFQPDALGFVINAQDALNLEAEILTGDLPPEEREIFYEALGVEPELSMQDQRRDALNVIMYWVNLIRSSVVNDAQNPMNGPPIVRLRHGTLYRDVPCVCQSYNISWDEGAGYDMKTLLPRVIKVQMNLEEYRLSTERDYKYGEPINRDALAGWEQLMDKPYSMDPGIPSDEVPITDPRIGGA